MPSNSEKALEEPQASEWRDPPKEKCVSQNMDAEVALLNVKSIPNNNFLFKSDVSRFYIITENVTERTVLGESSLRSLASSYETL